MAANQVAGGARIFKLAFIGAGRPGQGKASPFYFNDFWNIFHAHWLDSKTRWHFSSLTS
jgi:hypothetical protein